MAVCRSPGDGLLCGWGGTGAMSLVISGLTTFPVIEELSANYGRTMDTDGGAAQHDPDYLYGATQAAEVVHFINCCNLEAWRHAAIPSAFCR